MPDHAGPHDRRSGSPGRGRLLGSGSPQTGRPDRRQTLQKGAPHPGGGPARLGDRALPGPLHALLLPSGSVPGRPARRLALGQRGGVRISRPRSVGYARRALPDDATPDGRRSPVELGRPGRRPASRPGGEGDEPDPSRRSAGGGGPAGRSGGRMVGLETGEAGHGAAGGPRRAGGGLPGRAVRGPLRPSREGDTGPCTGCADSGRPGGPPGTRR